MKRIISYVLIFSVFVLLLTNCEKDESINIDLLQKSKYKTVSIDEAKNFLEFHRTSSFTKSNDLDLNYDIELAAHEDITNSNELLTVIPATTKYTNHYSRVLLLKVNEEIQSVVFSMYASDSSTSSNYSGELLITDLDGNFINGWRIENNEYVTQFVKKEETQNKSFTKNNEGEACPTHGECETVTVDCVICGFSLDEVTVVASSPKPFPYVPTEGIYEEGGSSGGSGNTSSGGDSSDSNGNETENSWAANNCGEGNIVDENGNCIVQINIDPSLENKPCQKNIVINVYNNKSELSNFILSAFGGDQNDINLTYTAGDLPGDDDGNTYTIFNSSLGTLDATITFDNAMLNQASDLYIATIAIHENLHATLDYTLRMNDINIPNPGLYELGIAYANWMREEENTNLDQHAFMATMVDRIAMSLQAYGQSQGYSLPDNYYNDLSWTGEIGFNNPTFIGLPFSKKTAIREALKNERGKPDENGVPKGEKCD